jgi:small subunit ribosomal protein S18
MMRKTKQANIKERACWFCVNQVNAIDYKDTVQLKRYTSSFAKIVPRRRSGVCAWHQRKLANAIKKARVLSLLPFVVK